MHSNSCLSAFDSPGSNISRTCERIQIQSEPAAMQASIIANAKFTALSNFWKMPSTPSLKTALADKHFFTVYAILKLTCVPTAMSASPGELFLSTMLKVKVQDSGCKHHIV